MKKISLRVLTTVASSIFVPFITYAMVEVLSGSNMSVQGNGVLPIAQGGTGNGSYASGSVPFMNGGVLGEDNENFFWNSTDHSLGVNRISTQGRATKNLFLIAGDATSNGDGGQMTIFTGTGKGDGSGGELQVGAGDAGDTGEGGIIELSGGSGGRSDGPGGSVILNGGRANGGDSHGGNIRFVPGHRSGSGIDGHVRIEDATSGTAAILETAALNGDDKTFTFPNVSGTFSLLSSDQTFSGLNRFEALGSRSTLYVGSATKTGCIALGDSDGSGLTYITANNGVMSASSTKPSICQ